MTLTPEQTEAVISSSERVAPEVRLAAHLGRIYHAQVRGADPGLTVADDAFAKALIDDEEMHAVAKARLTELDLLASVCEPLSARDFIGHVHRQALQRAFGK